MHAVHVDYLDMLLDVWIDGDGRLFVLDRDELKACISKGVIGQKELAWIEEQEKGIQVNLRRMIADLERLCSTCPTVV